jgi:Cu-processing system permease protein
MGPMIKVWQYSIYDLARNRWTYSYFIFFFAVAAVLLHMSGSINMAVASLLNIIIVLVPLIGTVFGAIYFYNSREFMELLLSQPIKRRSLFLGHYLGIATSLSMSLVLGLGIPFLLHGLWGSGQAGAFFNLISVGVFLTFIFSGLAYLIALTNDNRVKGFGLAILVWLVFAVLYDGVFMLSLMLLEDYPLEKFSLFAAMLNPIDLSRIIIMLQLDIAALLGYTGAVFNKYLGTTLGYTLAFFVLAIWVVLPVLIYLKIAGKKDF